MSSEAEQTGYLSFDVETDGPSLLAGNSMLAFGAVLLDQRCVELSSFRANLLPREGGESDPHTMVWWNARPDALIAVQEGARDSEVVMPEFLLWLDEAMRSNGISKVVWVARPASFDWPWLRAYCLQWGHRDLGHSCECVSSRWRQLIVDSGWSAERQNDEWEAAVAGLVFTHDPLDDARYQAGIWRRLLGLTA